MATITVTRTIPASVDRVFTALSDHANYKRFPGIKHSELVKPGANDPNGLGAQRIVDAGLLWVREDITHYEPDKRFDYLIIESRPPIKHEGGSLVFESVDGGTRVTWSSTLTIPVPLVGEFLAKLAGGKISGGFGAILRAVEQELAA